ncbi:MAG: hypothetical protein PVJ09_00785 [Candidatus Woesebacteria bacterium]|jgi:hypothetical protein
MGQYSEQKAGYDKRTDERPVFAAEYFKTVLTIPDPDQALKALYQRMDAYNEAQLEADKKIMISVGNMKMVVQTLLTGGELRDAKGDLYTEYEDILRFIPRLLGGIVPEFNRHLNLRTIVDDLVQRKLEQKRR